MDSQREIAGVEGAVGGGRAVAYISSVGWYMWVLIGHLMNVNVND